MEDKVKVTATKKRKKKKKVKMGKADMTIFVTVILLVSIGFLMVYSASSYYSLYNKGTTNYFFKKQIVWVPLGIIGMLYCMSRDYHIWKRYSIAAYLGVTALLIFVLVGPRSIVPDINGATRWINIKGFSLQPSELAKYAMVILGAQIIDNNKQIMGKSIKIPAIVLGLGGFYFILIEKENNLSIASVVLLATCVMLFVGGLNKKIISVLIPSGIGLGIVFVFSKSYRLARATNFLNPWADASGDGYQLVHSLLAIGSGGLFGSGLGQSKQKALYMPEPHNDFIFSIIAEEFGFIGCLIVIGLFITLILAALSVAVRAKDMYGKLVAVGITTVIGFQAIINIAVVTGSMPVTGVPLPFISYGGTSLVFTMAAMGVLLNISRQCREK